MGRATVGAFTGAVLGTVVWLGLETLTGRSLEWLVLLVGLLAGLGVRLLCKQRSSISGIIATTMALLGIIGGNIAQPFILEMIYDATAKPLPSAVKPHDVDDSDESQVDEPQDESAARSDAEDSARSVLAVDALRQSAPFYLGQGTGPNQGRQQIFEMLLYVISAILAYVLGAGSQKPAAAAPAAGEPVDSPE